MLVKVNLCKECAATLRAVLAEHGEEAMANRLGRVLEACPICREQVLPYKPAGARLVTKLKRRPS